MVDVVDGVDACGDPRLDSFRMVVVGVAADLLDMAQWLGEARTSGDVDGGRLSVPERARGMLVSAKQRTKEEAPGCVIEGVETGLAFRQARLDPGGSIR